MRSTLCAVLLSISFLMPGNIEAKDSQGVYYGTMYSCGQWVSERVNYKEWIEGYTTAINLIVKGKSDFFKNTDVQSIKLFVDQFCRKNPLEHSGAAMEHLMEQLNIPYRQ